MSRGAKFMKGTANRIRDREWGLQLLMLNFKKQIRKEGPRTNLFSTLLLVVDYVRRCACEPLLQGKPEAMVRYLIPFCMATYLFLTDLSSALEIRFFFSLSWSMHV